MKVMQQSVGAKVSPCPCWAKPGYHRSHALYVKKYRLVKLKQTRKIWKNSGKLTSGGPGLVTWHKLVGTMNQTVKVWIIGTTLLDLHDPTYMYSQSLG